MNADINWSKLAEAAIAARKELEFPRSKFRETVRLDAGSHYSENASLKRQPVNLISLFRRIVQRHLITKNPRFSLNTFEASLKPVLSATEAWGNRQLKRMKAAETFKRIVTDALFLVGIAKVSIVNPGEAALSGFAMKAGTPGLYRVPFQDFVYDTHAHTFSEASFLGHRYRVPRISITTDKSFSREREEIPISYDNMFAETGEEKTSAIGRTYNYDTEFEDMADVWEFYLPRHRLVATFMGDDAGFPHLEQSGKPLKVQPWVGPYCGPYHFLCLGNVADNALPKAPIMDLIDMHEGVNRNWRKLIDQMKDQKTLLLVRGLSTEDAKRIVQGNNGDTIRIDGDIPTPVDYGGPNAAMIQATDAMTKLFSWFSGNLDMLGGLSPQSKTLGQDKLLAQSASGAMVDMQEETVNHVSSVIEALCWYWIKNPYHTMVSGYELPGTGQSIARKVSPMDRLDIDFEELDISVDPYSFRHQTPQERTQALTQLVQTTILPMMPLLQQQGIGFDLNAYLTKMGKLLDLPDLIDIITIAPPLEESMTTPRQPSMPGQTRRDYVRHSAGGSDSQAAQENETSNAFSAAAAAATNSNGAYR